jgi:outer membrane protein OmpA-like peptidoglycan-associated protein
LQNAEGYLLGKGGSKPIGTVAREAVQMAEDSRIITLKKMDEERLASERQAGADREARAESKQVAAQTETARIAGEAERARLASQAEIARVAREADRARLAAQNEADRVKSERDAQTLVARNESDRLQRESDARLAASEAEADRLKRQNGEQAAIAQAEADRLKRENDAQRASSQADLDRAAQEKTQAEKERADLRAQLLTQFNVILETRDTARGLIVNMSDVLFDTAQFSLRPAAREKLAKVAGILGGHPGLKLQVEGHTDSVGGDDYNQKLSENRAMSVRDYLTQSGIATASVTSRGFGKTQPVASNDTSSGRQQNRRVELVVSGEIIGTDIRVSPILAVR